MYSLVTGIRNFLFDKSLLLHEAMFDLPVISVGNLEMGGTGKTPMVEYLVRTLLQGNNSDITKGITAKNIGIVTRGYGRKNTSPLLADASSTIDDIGDEPMQYLQEFGDEISLYIDGNRVRGINNLLKLKPQTNIIILDDAFQHRYVKPSLNILLTTFNRPYYKDHVLPFGRLRENKRGAKRADIIIVTKCPAGITQEQKNKITSRIKPLPHQQIFFTTFEYEIPSMPSKDIILLTGIAHPEPLVKYLQESGFNIKKHINYPDHHRYSEKEISNLKGYPIFTTQKDRTKLPDMANLYTVKVKHRFV
ncbi:MAG: tetraacyldisaccharide 4'-kinase [Bacteroidales bacterium]|jgi:tetraacyldisaccharide 4'-kinase|nr:tetraacyldisaccharide 4'-kinase [Bacteroidales bacterium]